MFSGLKTSFSLHALSQKILISLLSSAQLSGKHKIAVGWRQHCASLNEGVFATRFWVVMPSCEQNKLDDPKGTVMIWHRYNKRLRKLMMHALSFFTLTQNLKSVCVRVCMCVFVCVCVRMERICLCRLCRLCLGAPCERVCCVWWVSLLLVAYSKVTRLYNLVTSLV
jgi:hypothetical protein